MNPAVKQAAEALAIDLATTNGIAISAAKLPLSEPQMALKIPSYLVYLFGLSSIVSPDDDRGQAEIFCHLQKVYQEAKRSSDSRYRCSPSLSPCREAMSAIQADLRHKQEQLARQATEAAQELLNEESREKESMKGRVSKKNKIVVGRREPAPEKDEPRNAVGRQQENQPPQETLEDIMFSSALRYEEEEETESDNGGWTEVTKKQGSAKTKTGTEEPTKDPESTSMVVGVFELVQKRPETSTLLTSDQDDHEGLGSLMTNDNESQELSSLRARILQLEMDLASQQLQWQQERVSHQKALQQTVESYEERMLGLQLRLYISETRLKTFEEALEQHVAAVANNLAPTSPRTDDEQRKSRVLHSVKRISE